MVHYSVSYTVKIFLVTSTIFWSSQLHAYCVRDITKLQNNASQLNQNLTVVEKLLSQI